MGVDEGEHFLHNRDTSVATLPGPFAFGSERQGSTLAHGFRTPKIAKDLWFAKNASGAKTHVSTLIASGSREPGRPDAGHVTLCYMVVGVNFNSPLSLFISFAKALMEQGFPSDLFLGEGQTFCR